MATIFSTEQVEKLKTWQKVLETELARNWKEEEDAAEKEIQMLLERKNFQKDGQLLPDDLDTMFHLMRKFSANRALSKLLYTENGIEEFNLNLKNLYYGNDSFPMRVNKFLNMNGIGKQTLSQFLLTYDSTHYPLITYQTKDALELDAQQEQKAMDIAMEHFEIDNPQQYLDLTIDYLKDYVIFEEIKNLLNLEKYTSVNNLIWFAIEEGEDQEEVLKDYASISIEKDLRDYLEKNPFIIEKDLKLIEKEFDTHEVGKIDLLLLDSKGNEVVVELKKGRESDKVVGQITRYLGWVIKNRKPKVRGIIIVNEPDSRLEYSIIPFKGLIKVKYYKVKFEITDTYN